MKKLKKILKRQEKLLLNDFSDNLDIYRVSTIKTKFGETKLVKNLLYSKVPCYLSIKEEKVAGEDSHINIASSEYLIFLARGVKILASDYIELKKEDMIYKGRASKPYLYDTHIELSFLVEEIV